MIKLDPEEEADEDDSTKTPQKNQMPPPQTSQASNDVIVNHMVTNSVQINSRVNIPAAVEPQHNFVSFQIKFHLFVYWRETLQQEKAINANSIPKSSQKPVKTKTPSKKSSSASAKKKKRRKLSSSEDDESDYEDDDDY